MQVKENGYFKALQSIIRLQRLPLTRALKGFFLRVQTCVLVDVNQPLPWFFTLWPRADSFPVSRALGRTCPRFSRFCDIFRIRHSFMSRLRGVRIGWVFVGGNSNNRHTHTVSYNHISFLNARSQLVWVLASFGFYSITWRMISRSAGYEIHFRKQPLFRGNFLPCRCDIFRFFEFILDPLQYVVHGFRVFIQSNK